MSEQEIVLDTVAMISQLMGELETKAFEQEGFFDITMNQIHYLETVASWGSYFCCSGGYLGVTQTIGINYCKEN